MTKFQKGLLSCMVCLFVALPLAQAQNAPGDEGPSQKWRPGQRIQEMYAQLNLTDEQKQQLEATKVQHRTQMKSERQQMKSYRQAFQEELMKPQLDMSRINGIHNGIKALQSQMEDERLNSVLAVRTILTPQQFSKFSTLMYKHKQEHEEHEEHEER